MEHFENPPEQTDKDLDLIDQPLPGTVTVPELDSIVSAKRLQELERSATSDKLTGLLNRHGFEEELSKIKKILDSEQKFNRLEDLSKKEYALLVVDIDKFKSFNDTYGHNVGDAVLELSAKFFQGHFRPTDTICRWGGEEFVILLQDVHKTQFLNRLHKRFSDSDDQEFHTLNFQIRIAEEIKNGETKYRVLDNEDHQPSEHETLVEKTISFSGGLVSFVPNKDDLEQKINEADGHLYNAKESGRNQIQNNGTFITSTN